MVSLPFAKIPSVKKEMKDPKSITMKNGKPATQGKCPTCGTKMFRIGKSGRVCNPKKYWGSGILGIRIKASHHQG